MKSLDFFLGQVFHVNQPVARAFKRRDNFVGLQVYRQRVFVLFALAVITCQARIAGIHSSENGQPMNATADLLTKTQPR